MWIFAQSLSVPCGAGNINPSQGFIYFVVGLVVAHLFDYTQRKVHVLQFKVYKAFYVIAHRLNSIILRSLQLIRIRHYLQKNHLSHRLREQFSELEITSTIPILGGVYLLTLQPFYSCSFPFSTTLQTRLGKY